MLAVSLGVTDVLGVSEALAVPVLERVVEEEGVPVTLAVTLGDCD